MMLVLIHNVGFKNNMLILRNMLPLITYYKRMWSIVIVHSQLSQERRNNHEFHQRSQSSCHLIRSGPTTAPSMSALLPPSCANTRLATRSTWSWRSPPGEVAWCRAASRFLPFWVWKKNYHEFSKSALAVANLIADSCWAFTVQQPPIPTTPCPIQSFWLLPQLTFPPLQQVTL